MGLGKLQAFLMGIFGGAVSGQGATTGQALVKQANGSWAPGTVSAGSAAQFVTTSDGSASAPAFLGPGSVNTGIYFPALAQLAIAAGGQTVLGASTLAVAVYKTLYISTNYIEGEEIADPSAPSPSTGRLYFRDNGAGKTQLCVRFNTGAVQVLATEP